jgi:transcriptional regulator with XRE-family HTH domain
MLARTLKACRKARGLSQAALAAASGASRVTIARLEAGAGRDFRLGTLQRLCQALELELTAVEPRGQKGLETRLARAQESVRRLDRRRRHAALAARLLGMREPAARALVHQASREVDRWERNRLCSDHYIARWRRMLAGSIRTIALRLLEHDEWTDALLQNSPWQDALDPVAA